MYVPIGKSIDENPISNRFISSPLNFFDLVNEGPPDGVEMIIEVYKCPQHQKT